MNPGVFSVQHNRVVLVAMALAVIGGLVIVFVPDWASSTQNMPGIPEKWLQGPTGNLILGVLLIVLTFVLPGGIVSGIRKLRAKVVVVIPRPPGRFAAGPGADDSTPTAAESEPDVAESDSDTAGTAEMSGTRSTE